MSKSKRHPTDPRLTHDSSKAGSELGSLTTSEEAEVDGELDQAELDQSGLDQTGQDQTGLGLGGLEQDGLTHGVNAAVAQSDLTAANRTEQTQRLINEFHPAVYRYAFWLTGCQTTAEDITQDVFMRAFRGIHNLRSQEAAKSWLMTITRNEFARWCQKRVPTPVETITEPNEQSDNTLQAVEDVEWVRHALLELPHDFRIVVLMYYFEQRTYAEIAEHLEIPIGTVMSRLSRGKKQLRNALDQLAEPPTSRTAESD